MGWIGIDLDGTLAEWGTKDPLTAYVHYNVLVVGAPIPVMVDRVKSMIAEGKDVRIFTARVGPATDDECLTQLRRLPGYEDGPLPQRDWENYQRTLIECWCQEHLGMTLPITHQKDFHMFELWDDRCIQVITNTGETLLEKIERLTRQLESFIAAQHYGEGL